ncbi:MAG: CoA transferase [Novosphingobium sp.]
MKSVKPGEGQLPYAGLKVLEVADTVGGEFLGRMLAEMGADVIKAEPPAGSPTRAVGPFAGHVEGPDTSLTFWLYNCNKRSVIVDLETGFEEALAAYLTDADVLILTFQPAQLQALGLDLDALAQRYPRLIIVSVTPYGLTGPWADYHSSNLVALAGGGPLNMCGYDDHSIPPVNPGGDQAHHTVTAFAHIGLLVALLHRQQTGEGQVLDVSMHGANAVNQELGNPFWFYNGVNVERQTCRHAQPVMTAPALFACADGHYVYYTLILADTRAWNILVQWMDELGFAAMLVEPEYQDIKFRQDNFSQIQELVECFFLVQDGHAAYLEGQRRGLPIGIMNTPEDLIADEHLQARNFFQVVDSESAVGEVLFPGESYRFSAFGSVPRAKAPRLGEHQGYNFQ